ncbi:MAG: DMT family transporter [Flavobacteriales bacterium]|nr:DMT family transporter [Flavobacteriales bacterium]
MKISDNKYTYHIIALITIMVWGSTFVSTKTLIQNGMTPSEIFFIRFVLAYVGIWAVSHKKLFSQSIKDELLLAAAGITGGSLYFLTENTALEISQASDVSFIVSSTPILTALAAYIFHEEKRPSLMFAIGGVIAMTGVGLIVFNGSFFLNISPLGNILALSAAALWAIYSVVIKRLDGRYSSSFITRKVFFYGLITILPAFIFSPWQVQWDTLLRHDVLVNILFLGLVASLLCFVIWNIVMKNIGVVRATNYIYMIPLIAMITSSIFLDEKITLLGICGAGMILLGVYISGLKKKTTNKR